MKIFDYLIVLIILIWFIASICYIIWIKKQGKSICCGSSQCKSCRTCKQKSIRG